MCELSDNLVPSEALREKTLQEPLSSLMSRSLLAVVRSSSFNLIASEGKDDSVDYLLLLNILGLVLLLNKVETFMLCLQGFNNVERCELYTEMLLAIHEFRVINLGIITVLSA